MLESCTRRGPTKLEIDVKEKNYQLDRGYFSAPSYCKIIKIKKNNINPLLHTKPRVVQSYS